MALQITLELEPSIHAGWRAVQTRNGLKVDKLGLGSQSFVPLTGARCIALVALGDDLPDESTLAAFLVTGQQGVTLRPGVWHHPLIALDAGDFLVIERAGAVVDCEVRALPHAVALRWNAHTGVSQRR